MVLGGCSPAPRSASQGSSTFVTERAASPQELSCAEAGWTSCLDGYDVMLSHPIARGASRPWHDCRQGIAEQYAAGRLGLTTDEWPAPIESPSGLEAAILEGTGMGFLFEPEALEGRPLEVVVLNESITTSPTGTRYRHRRLVLRDPYVGDIPVVVLLPLGGRSVPGVVAMPGHAEEPSHFRDQRLGRFFPEQGFALLIVGFRAWTRPDLDHETSLAFLCEGFSLAMARAYEGLVALRYLQTLPETSGRRLGVIGHSGGAMAANLLAWMSANPAAAQVTDIQAEYLNIDDHGLVDCESHPALYALWPSIDDFGSAPRPILEVPYGLGSSWEDEVDPDPDDPAGTAAYMPFLLRELTPVP